MPESAKNKYHYDLTDVYAAELLTDDATEGATFGTPQRIYGAVSMELEAQGEITKFRADASDYIVVESNNGYEGDLEMARFPDQMRQDVWGEELVATDNVLIENANVQPKPFALLFQIDGDKTNNLYCLYNCNATRPSVAGSTTNENKEPQTETCTISAVPLENGNVKAATTATTTADVRNNWFKKVYEKPAPAA